MLDLSLFKSRVFSLAIGARFISFLGGSAVFFLMPFYVIQGLGHSASHAAFLMIPGSISMIVIGPLAGRLSDRVGTRWPAVFGMSVSTMAMISFATLTTESSDSRIAMGMTLSGIGMASFSSPNSSAIIGSLPREKYGIVSAFVNLARTSANMSGVALATTVVTFHMAASGFEPSLSTVEGGDAGATLAFVEGMARAYTISACAMIVALTMTIFRGEVQAQPDRVAEQPGPASTASGDDE
jgi:MFS family permease